MPPENIAPEKLAYWYLRLNGFLTTVNFVVHPDRGSLQETDVDILGVRFPYRAENLLRRMKDDKLFTSVGHRTAILQQLIKVPLAAVGERG